MKKIIKLLAFLSIFGFYTTFAASVDHFDVKLNKDTAGIDEALDLTIEAFDKNGNTVKAYNGTVLILSESDSSAELPKEVKDSTYIFKDTDSGKVKFENAVKFKKTGKQTLNVYDLNDDTISGIAEINITSEKKAETIEISIISPEDGFKVGKNSISVSGKTQKNHQVSIKLNGKEAIKTVSNSDGVFEEKVDNVTNGDNMIQASVLDADGKEVGTSKSVKITVDAKSPEFKSIKLLPGKSIDSESELSIEVLADKGLTDVQAVINDTIVKLVESTEGLYKGKTNAPKDAGEYKVDVSLKNEMGNETKKVGVETITVKAIELNAATEEKTVIVTDGLKEETKKIYKITNIKLTKLKTQSILTWDLIEGVDSYNIYKQLDGNKLELIENVKEPRYTVNIVGDKITYDYFVVEPVVKTVSGDIVKGELSEATKIQTGPKEYLILAFLSLLIGFFIVKRKKALSI